MPNPSNLEAILSGGILTPPDFVEPEEVIQARITKARNRIQSGHIAVNSRSHNRHEVLRFGENYDARLYAALASAMREMFREDGVLEAYYEQFAAAEADPDGQAGELYDDKGWSMTLPVPARPALYEVRYYNQATETYDGQAHQAVGLTVIHYGVDSERE